MKVLSLNIEGTKHLDKVKKLIEIERPEVIFLMETPIDQIKALAGESYPYTDFLQNDIIGNIRELSGETPTGVAVLSKHKISERNAFSCGLPPVNALKPEGTSHTPILLMVLVEREGERYLLGGVHYTWTKRGEATELQKEQVRALLEHTSKMDPHVIMGDFNIPRGNASYALIAEKYEDHVPATITTTIDPDLHTANRQVRGGLAFVVDYVWSKPGYKVGEVRVVSGVSDHCALVFDVDIVHYR